MMNFQEFLSLLNQENKVKIEFDEMERVDRSYSFLQEFAKNKVIYGINTGFGPMAQYKIPTEDLEQLQYNLIRSHAAGVGSYLSEEFVRASMIARLMTFLQGCSGVHPDLVKTLTAFIDFNIIPLVPSHGSVGASGDLVQLAHIALALIGEGRVKYNGEIFPTDEVLSKLGIEPVKVKIREGLAVTNGTAVMTGIGLVNLKRARILMGAAVQTSVLMNEVACSYDDFMASELNGKKLHIGQEKIADTMRWLSEGSQLTRNREEDFYGQSSNEEIFNHKVQPYYSLRCVPQILGPVLDTLKNVEKVLIAELNSVDDNPVIDLENRSIYHGGNFHGDYISFEMDKMKIGITKLTMLAERQMNYLFHDRINGILPPFLNMGRLGLNYGLQAVQFTATSTTAECQMLSNPMYVHSIPNNNDNQDVVSMGTNSALIASQVIENSFQVMAIHLMAVSQAVDCLLIQNKLSLSSQQFYSRIREIVDVNRIDTVKAEEINRLIEFLRNEYSPNEIIKRLFD